NEAIGPKQILQKGPDKKQVATVPCCGIDQPAWLRYRVFPVPAGRDDCIRLAPAAGDASPPIPSRQAGTHPVGRGNPMSSGRKTLTGLASNPVTRCSAKRCSIFAKLTARPSLRPTGTLSDFKDSRHRQSASRARYSRPESRTPDLARPTSTILTRDNY